MISRLIRRLLHVSGAEKRTGRNAGVRVISTEIYICENGMTRIVDNLGVLGDADSFHQCLSWERLITSSPIKATSRD
jgi:hypothetical protein